MADGAARSDFGREQRLGLQQNVAGPLEPRADPVALRPEQEGVQASPRKALQEPAHTLSEPGYSVVG